MLYVDNTCCGKCGMIGMHNKKHDCDRAERKAMHMLQLTRHGKGMETEEDIKMWSDKFEKANE